jgi:hypothetical protein
MPVYKAGILNILMTNYLCIVDRIREVVYRGIVLNYCQLKKDALLTDNLSYSYLLQDKVKLMMKI